MRSPLYRVLNSHCAVCVHFLLRAHWIGCWRDITAIAVLFYDVATWSKTMMCTRTWRVVKLFTFVWHAHFAGVAKQLYFFAECKLQYYSICWWEILCSIPRKYITHMITWRFTGLSILILKAMSQSQNYKWRNRRHVVTNGHVRKNNSIGVCMIKREKLAYI